MEAGAHRLL